MELQESPNTLLAIPPVEDPELATMTNIEISPAQAYKAYQQRRNPFGKEQLESPKEAGELNLLLRIF